MIYLYKTRKASRRFYNWSSIRCLSSVKFQMYWVIVLIPILFSFLHDINHFTTYIQNSLKREIVQPLINFSEQHNLDDLVDLYSPKEPDKLNEQENQKILPSGSLVIDWKTSIKYLFYGAFFLFIANIFHRFAPKESLEFSCREFFLNESKNATLGGEAYFEQRYIESIERIRLFENHFNLEWEDWGDMIENEMHMVRLAIIEAGAKSYYEMYSTKKIFLLFITSCCYVAGFSYSGIVLVNRFFIVFRGY